MEKIDNIHANAIMFHSRVFLLRGKSASGKSDLCLRLIYHGGILISDDRTLILRDKNNILYVAPPDNLAGKIEIRGIGIVDMPYMKNAPIDIICDLSEKYPRYPEKNIYSLYENIHKYYILNPFESSVIQKMEMIAKMYDTPSKL